MEAEEARLREMSEMEKTETSTTSASSAEMTISNVTEIALSSDGKDHDVSNGNNLSQPIESVGASEEFPIGSFQHNNGAPGGNSIAQGSSIDIDLSQIYVGRDHVDILPIGRNPMHDL